MSVTETDMFYADTSVSSFLENIARRHMKIMVKRQSIMSSVQTLAAQFISHVGISPPGLSK